MSLGIKYVKKPERPKPINLWVSPIGFWKVSTEGDDEGRTSTELGTFYGHFAKVAFYLANKCFYTLSFRAVEKSNEAKEIPQEIIVQNKAVIVSFNDYGGDTKELNSAEAIQTWLGTNEILVAKSNYYKSWGLVLNQ